MTEADLGFVHVFRPAPVAAGSGGATAPGRTLLMLHGTGGDERDLLPLAQMLDPQAAVLSPRGKVLEQGMPRFFRRLSEGVFDVDDLRRRTFELAEFVEAAADRYEIEPRGIIAAGFSNGANIAASMLLLKPGVLAGAILFRAMVPLVPDPMPPPSETPVFLSNGRRDPLVPADHTERLAALLRRTGASVTLAWQDAGHELTRADLEQAREWLTTQNSALKTQNY
jgi:phospholipase/carboxylesterase